MPATITFPICSNLLVNYQ